MRWLASTLLFVALLAAAPPLRAGEAVSVCGAPPALVTAGAPLPQFGTAVAGGGTIDILAVGSATTVGSVTTSGQPSATGGRSFPWYMIRALQAAKPSVQFRLTVRGSRGMKAEDMLPLIEGAIQQHRYALVLWQTGTVEAVRGLQPEALLEVLRSGAERVRAAGGNVVLIDPQFSRFLRANTDLDSYENAMQQAALTPGVALFHRFDLMHAWAKEGRIDLERTAKADRERALEELNDCLGKALAQFVLSGAAMRP